ncbi:MAG TPA: LemA family protein [Candidatus Peribacteraceae bacterium]|nr:LemA family protein [Candidatus Peribacteraceae bacterium]
MSPSLIIVGILVVIVAYIVLVYNGLIQARNRVQEAFSDIGVQQKRRHDLIPNLIETVKGYAAHEQGTLDKVVQARNAAMSASGSGDLQKMQQAENALSSTLRSLFALAESYPDLKANQNFLHLQQELVDAEDKIQAARRFHNAVVQQFNTKVQQFPSNLIANAFGFKEEEFFAVEDEATAVPKVKF